MTIKDIESHSGIPRANIRFYESQGLINPARGENGYRDYSLDDLKMLLRIKLLRSLDVSIDEIKALISGRQELAPVLEQQLQTLQQRQSALSRSETLCRMMLSDKAEFDSLDAQRYLETDLRQQDMQKVISADRISPVAHPFRRFFARSLDLSIYVLVINAFLALIGMNISALSSEAELLISLVSVVMMLCIEPLLLHFFGTTPGKWIFGLYITDMNGEKCSLYTGFYRCWDILRYGYGFFIPFYELYRLYKSMIACSGGEDLPWENDSTMLIRDTRPWRIIAFFGAHGLRIALFVLIGFLSTIPVHTGALSPAQFAENYNRYARYYSMGAYELTPSGEFETPANTAIIDLSSSGNPEVEFVTDSDGNITTVKLSKLNKSSHVMPSSYSGEITLAALSLVRAQPGALLYAPQLEEMLKFLKENPFSDFKFNFYGVEIICDYEYSGYIGHTGFGALWPDESTDEQYYSLTCTMSLE